MATIISQPGGVSERTALYGSPVGASAHATARRKNLTKMLAKRLQQEHGTDAVRMALIQDELDAFMPLQRGDVLKPADLALLERNVKTAVQAVGGDTRDIMPAKRWPRPKRDFACDLSAVADWTAVSKHKMGFYLGEQQREMAERERKKEPQHIAKGRLGWVPQLTAPASSGGLSGLLTELRTRCEPMSR